MKLVDDRKIFYGIYTGHIWYISDKIPKKESYIVIHANCIAAASVKLNSIISEYDPRIYL